VVTTLWARRHVIRPIRIFGVLAIAGVVAAILTFARVPVPGGFLAMNACLVLAFAVNQRPTSRSTHSMLWRGLWIASAVLMVSRIVSGSRGIDAGSGGIGAVSVGVPEALIEWLPMLIGFGYVVRGLRPDASDRLLAGALAGLLSPVPVAIIRLMLQGIPSLESDSVWWAYPWWLLFGAALARANGNLRRP
jgi:hypothetical protein